jgi:hypothetical protein
MVQYEEYGYFKSREFLADTGLGWNLDHCENALFIKDEECENDQNMLAGCISYYL